MKNAEFVINWHLRFQGFFLLRCIYIFVLTDYLGILEVTSGSPKSYTNVCLKSDQKGGMLIFHYFSVTFVTICRSAQHKNNHLIFLG